MTKAKGYNVVSEGYNEAVKCCRLISREVPALGLKWCHQKFLFVSWLCFPLFLLLSSGSWCAQGFVWSLERTSRKSRDTWSNRKIWPWSTKQSRAKANRVLRKQCTGHSEHPLPTTQEKTLCMVNTKMTDGQYWNQIDYILCSQRWRSSVQSEKIRPGSYRGSDHELFIAKLRLKLKEVGKTTRPSGMT